jgi:hypothetical protein
MFGETREETPYKIIAEETRGETPYIMLVRTIKKLDNKPEHLKQNRLYLFNKIKEIFDKNK